MGGQILVEKFCYRFENGCVLMRQNLREFMQLSSLKSIIKNFLFYEALDQTKETRNLLAKVMSEFQGVTLPYAPTHQGDLIHLLIARNNYADCLETGFASGSTAAYMLAATSAKSGKVISIDNSQGGHEIEIGKRCIELAGMTSRHLFISDDSSVALRHLREDGKKFDFVFLDGWKTFDHTAYEFFLFDEMLTDGGCVFIDDTYMPSLRQLISFAKKYYEYQEIDYRDYGQDWKKRLYLSTIETIK